MPLLGLGQDVGPHRQGKFHLRVALAQDALVTQLAGSKTWRGAGPSLSCVGLRAPFAVIEDDPLASEQLHDVSESVLAQWHICH